MKVLSMILFYIYYFFLNSVQFKCQDDVTVSVIDPLWSISYHGTLKKKKTLYWLEAWGDCLLGRESFSSDWLCTQCVPMGFACFPLFYNHYNEAFLVPAGVMEKRAETFHTSLPHWEAFAHNCLET